MRGALLHDLETQIRLHQSVYAGFLDYARFLEHVGSELAEPALDILGNLYRHGQDLVGQYRRIEATLCIPFDQSDLGFTLFDFVKVSVYFLP